MASRSSETVILFLSADPTNEARLRLGQEVRDIQQRLSLAKLRKKIKMVERMSVRPGDITQAIFDTEPQIIHFSGHGTASGDLCFENELGKMHPIPPEALASLFALLSDQVNCVILNACYSAIQAQAIAEHIDYVIGMKQGIGDNAAITFATGFYKALGAGRAIEEAFNYGIVELKLFNLPEDLTPVLIKKKSIQAAHFALRSSYKQIGDNAYQREYHNYPGYVCFDLKSQASLHEETEIFVNPQYYPSLKLLLDDLFIHYLSPIVPPYSYGTEWLLSNRQLITAPVTWVARSNEPASEVEPFWSQSVSLSDQCIMPDTHWDILLQGEIKRNLEKGVFALVTNEEALAQSVLSTPKAIHFIYHRGYFNLRAINEVDTSKYKFKYVLSDWLHMGFGGMVLEESGQQIDPDLLMRL
jgi:hypothetical protein